MIKFLALLLASALMGASPIVSEQPSSDSVLEWGRKVADWQIKHSHDSQNYVFGPYKGRKHHLQDWTNGALYAGMNEFCKIIEDKKYENWLKDMGTKGQWKLHQPPYHADSHAVGQMFLNFYQKYQDPKMLLPTQERFDWILAHRKKGSLNIGPNLECYTRWSWCDALFMAPPVWARLAKITGEAKYLTFMDEEYHATYDLLWNKEDHLFSRDSTFLNKCEKNSKKIYWSRGNGWVFGGLALMIPDLPKSWEGRAFYIDLYKTMAAKLKEIQRPDGTWSMGLLGSINDYPSVETSGTSFFVFGLAWGIRNSILDKNDYEPVVLNGWQALVKCVNPEGMLGYVQPIGAAPGEAFADKTEIYGVGAFLAASAEVYKLVGGLWKESFDLAAPIKDASSKN